MSCLKKAATCYLVFIVSLLLIAPFQANAAEDVSSDVTISFSEKNLKTDDKTIVPKDPKTGKSTGTGKDYYNILPKTGDTMNTSLIYAGLVLILGTLSYITILKKGEAIDE